MAETQKTTAKPRRRWLRIALLVSLIFNLLFVGLVVGAAVGKRKYDRGDTLVDSRVLQHLGPYGRALPKESRVALARELRPSASEGALVRRSLRDGFRDILGVLRADAFDADAYARLMAEQQAMINGRVNDGQKALLNRIKTMSHEERRAYADALEKALRRGPSRDGRPPAKR